jgi:membrane protein insertase Oxa1/YidC/SpoIIIJ
MIYSFISLPEYINPFFLGIDLSKPNIYLAILTAVVQYFQAKTGMPAAPKSESKDKTTQVTEMVTKQMVLFIPLITFFVLYSLPSALGLYWTITTILTILQQRKIFNKKEV